MELSHPVMWHVALGSWQWIHQVAAACNVIRGSGMTCHGIRPNVRHTGILHLVSILTISPQSTCYSAPFCMGENRPKSENWATLTPRSSATVHRTEKSTGSAKLPGPWTTTWSKQYLSAVHPVTCSLLWVRCLFDRLRQIFDFQIFRFWHPDYNPDRAQKLISSSMSRHLSTCKISSKSMHAFLSNLANRQTDKHRRKSHIPPPLCRR